MSRLKEVLLMQCETLERGLTALEYQIHEMRWELYRLRNPSQLVVDDFSVEEMMEEIKEEEHETRRF